MTCRIFEKCSETQKGISGIWCYQSILDWHKIISNILFILIIIINSYILFVLNRPYTGYYIALPILPIPYWLFPIGYCLWVAWVPWAKSGPMGTHWRDLAGSIGTHGPGPLGDASSGRPFPPTRTLCRWQPPAPLQSIHAKSLWNI